MGKGWEDQAEAKRRGEEEEGEEKRQRGKKEKLWNGHMLRLSV